MIETSKKLPLRLLIAVVLPLVAACSVSAGGQIPCADDSSCPADYPVCSAGKCNAGTSTSAISVAIVGVEGHLPTDQLRGTVTVTVTARANSGVQSVSLAAGTKTLQPNASSQPPLYKFDVVTSDVAAAPADVDLTATVTAGDGTTGTSPKLTVHIDNSLPTLTTALVGSSNVSDGTMVKFDVTTSKTVASIRGTVSGTGSGTLSEIAAASGNTHHFGYAISSADAEGAHDVTFTTTDQAGNTNSATSTGAFTVRHPFVLGALTVSTGHTVNEQAGALPAATAGTVVTASIAVPASAALGTSKPVFTLTTAAATKRAFSTATVTTGSTTNTWTATYTVVAGDADGMASVTVAVTDVAGNTPAAPAATVVVDKAAPVGSAITGGGIFDTTHNAAVFTTLANKRLQSASVSSSNGDTGSCTCDGIACGASSSSTPVVACTVTVSHGAPATPTATLTLTDTLGNITAATTAFQKTYTVVALPQVTSFETSGALTNVVITTGDTLPLSASYSGGTGSISNGLDPQTIGIATGASIQVQPAASTTYTLSVTNTAGTVVTAGVTVSVIAAPTFTGTLAVSPNSFTQGDPGNIQFTAPVFGPQVVSASITDGTSVVVPSITSGGTANIPKPSVTTTYTILMLNAATVARAAQSSATAFVGPLPNITSYVASNATSAITITSGATTTLTAVFTGGTGLLQPGSIPMSSGVPVVVAPTSTTTYQLTVTNTAGGSISSGASTQPASVVVTVIPAPVVNSFTGPTYAAQSSLVTLNYDITNAACSAANNNCNITDGTTTLRLVANGTGTSGGSFVLPASGSQTYTLTVTNAGGAVSVAHVTVQTVAPPSIGTFVAHTSPIATGTIAQLDFTGISGACTTPGSCYVSNNQDSTTIPVAVTGSGNVVTSAALTTTTTFTLTVSNLAGQIVTRTATVVVAPAPVCTGLSAGASSVTSGTSTTLTANFANGTGTVDHSVGAVTSGVPINTPALTTNTTFTLTVTPPVGSTCTASTSVTVVAAPSIVSFTGPSSGTVSTGVTLSYNIAGGQCSVVGQCSISDGTTTFPISANGAGTTASTYTLPASGTANYVLTVKNSLGATATASVAVQTVAAPAIGTFAAHTSPIATGSAGQLDFTGVAGNCATAGACFITNNRDGTTIAVSATGSGNVATPALTATTIYTLRVSNSAGTVTTASATLTVAPAPVCTSLVPGAATVTAGTSTTLTANFSNGTGTVDNSVGAVTSGIAINTPPINSNTTFTLTVTPPAGSTCTTGTTVTVVPAPAITSFTGPTNGTASSVVTLSYTIANGQCSVAGQCTISDGTTTFNIAANGSGNTGTSFVLPASGSKAYTLTVKNSLNTAATSQVTVATVAAPAIGSFVLHAAPVLAGATAQLDFTGVVGACATAGFCYVTNSADTSVIAVSATGSGFVTTGALGATSVVYTLTVFNLAGLSTSAAVPIEVLNTFAATGTPGTVRFGAAATLLGNLKVLIAGGSTAANGSAPVATTEIYDPVAGTYTPGPAMNHARYQATATLLDNGQVAIIGGSASPKIDIYDPGNNAFVADAQAPSLNVARSQHTATMLVSGKVLVAGGTGTNAGQSAELYDQVAGSFTELGAAHVALVASRALHTATRLNDGRVLLVGGNASSATNTAEVFDGTSAFTATSAVSGPNGKGDLPVNRAQHTATLLNDGRVLIAGGVDGAGTRIVNTSGAFIYDPTASSSAFGSAISLQTARTLHTATKLPTGKVLLAGGVSGGLSTAAELFDPSVPGSTTTVSQMKSSRAQQTATFTFGGTILISGGVTPNAPAEVFDPE